MEKNCMQFYTDGKQKNTASLSTVWYSKQNWLMYNPNQRKSEKRKSS